MDITLQFEDERTLNAWVEVPVHDELLDELDAYRSRDYWQVVQTDNVQADPSSLEWESIKVT